MKLAPALICTSGLVAGLFAAATALAASSNRPEPLPKDAQRQVLGIWKLDNPSCTRALEQISNRFFIVARCRQPADIDGSTGIPLTRVSETSYKNFSGVVYEIDGEGHLLVKVGNEVFERGVPQKSLWPE